MIQSFVFDLGNVIYNFDFTKVITFLNEYDGRVGPLVFPSLKKTLAEYELGRITSEQFFSEVRVKTGFRGDYETFRKGFSDIFEENQEVAPVVHDLLDHYPLFVLSNTNQMHIEFITNRFPLLNKVRGHVYSYEEGLAKPDLRIFKRAIERFLIHPESTLYVDDNADNVAAAASVGMVPLHYAVKNGHPQVSLRTELERMGVRVA